MSLSGVEEKAAADAVSLLVPGDNLDPELQLSPDENDAESSRYSSSEVGSNSAEDEASDACEEGTGGYRKGGYHPISIGDLFHSRYRIEKKLGWGHFSTVWLAIDETLADGSEPKALKVQKSAPHYLEAALDEVKLLRRARSCGAGSEYVVRLYDSFFVHGPNGKHMCMVFEVLGENLLSLIKRYDYRGIPLPLVREISRHILRGLDYLHTEAGIIHTDLKPENIVLKRRSTIDVQALKSRREKKLREKDSTKKSSIVRPKDPAWKSLNRNQKKRMRKRIKEVEARGQKEAMAQSADNGEQEADIEHIDEFDIDAIVRKAAEEPILKLADLGNACWTNRHFTDDITTRQYRSPEAIVGAKYSTPVDIWALATLVFELVTGDYLFDPKEDTRRRYSRNEDHLALITELLGPFPRSIWASGKRSQEYFRRKGELRNIRHLEFWPLRSVLVDKYKMAPVEAEMLSSFLLPMLDLDPSARATAAECLQHPWLDAKPPLPSQDAELNGEERSSAATANEKTRKQPELEPETTTTTEGDKAE